MIALLKYGSGLPFNRMQGLQGALGIPLPASTQWDIINAQAKHIEPVHAELIRQASGGDVLYNDDTTIKILELMGKRAKQQALVEGSVEGGGQEKQRTGLFTSGVVSTSEGRRIALFFSGRKHAGENLKDVLLQRAADLAPPIQMCDALSRNLPAELETIVANCLAHGRRQFVEVAEQFPDECRHLEGAGISLLASTLSGRGLQTRPGQGLFLSRGGNPLRSTATGRSWNSAFSPPGRGRPCVPAANFTKESHLAQRSAGPKRVVSRNLRNRSTRRIR
jgi:hypothetical protein